MAQISSRMRHAFTGISGILVAPFDQNDTLDTDKLDPIIDRAAEAGVDVLVANGNTGEFYSLESGEAEHMMHAVVEKVAGRVPVVNGVGRSIGEACTLARASRTAGVDAIMVHQPPDPFAAPRGVVEYVQRVADAADGVPLMLYLRNDAMGTDYITKLTEIPGVAGVKWATPNIMNLSAAIKASDDDVVWVCGLAEVWAPAMYAVGAQGFTSGLINVWPARSVDILSALRTGRYADARRLIGEIEEFEAIRAEELSGTNVSVVKGALQLLGNDCGRVRAPGAWPLSAAQQARMDALLRRVGVC